MTVCSPIPQIYEQYDEEEIGALDHEDISGHIPADSILLSSVLDEFEKNQTKPYVSVNAIRGHCSDSMWWASVSSNGELHDVMAIQVTPCFYLIIICNVSINHNNVHYLDSFLSEF